MFKYKMLTYCQLSDAEQKVVDQWPLLLGVSIDEPRFYIRKNADETKTLTTINNRITGHYGYGPVFCFHCRKLYEKKTECACPDKYYHCPNSEEEAKALLIQETLREQFNQRRAKI